MLKTIGELCEVVNGGTPKTGEPKYWSGKHLWITPAEMGKRHTPFVSDTERKITDAGLRDSSAKMLPPNSVILSARAPIGHLVINTEHMATNQGCKGLIPCPQLQYKFLYYYLGSIVELLNSLGTGATFKELSGGKLKEVTIPIPSFSEQQRIVEILDKAFEGISIAKINIETNLKNARILFEDYLNAVFTQRGNGWQEETLGNVCAFTGGSQPSKSVFSKDQTEDNIRLIQIRDFKSDKYLIFIPRAQARRFCKVDDIMIGRYGPPIFQILRGLEGAYNVALIKAVPNESKLLREFLFYFLKHPRIQQYVIFHSERAAGQSGLNKDTLEPYPIAYPSLKEQEKIIKVIHELECDVEKLESIYQKKLDALDELKQSILQKAFSGGLRYELQSDIL